MLPSFFVAHGSPTLAIEDNEYTRFLHKLVQQLPKPKAIVLFSAHWESQVQKISSVPQYETIYDFRGFPDAMYRITYPAKGNLPLSLEIQRLLAEEGITSEQDDSRGLDHGAWVPLHLMYPAADIPVVALSVNPNLIPEEQYRMGRALQKLREKDVLILGSGGTVHNLRRVSRNAAQPEDWALRFDEWLGEQLETWNTEALFDYENRAPYAADAVPTSEHFDPIFYSMGAADLGKKAKLLHRQYQFGALSLSCWMFG